MSFWDWVPKALAIAVPAAATVYGAKLANDAQKDAANTANKATIQAADTTASAQKEATAAELEGIKVAEQNLLGQQRAASPGLVHLQGIIGRGDQLTDVQKQSVADARRTTLDALHGGSLRGSARATTAAVRDVEDRLTKGFIQQNRDRADQVGSNLSGQYFNAGNNIADLNLRTGQTVSQGLINTGNINANAINTTGQNTVNAGLNQAAIRGQAIGDISAVIADQVKADNEKKRDSSYNTVAGVA